MSYRKTDIQIVTISSPKNSFNCRLDLIHIPFNLEFPRKSSEPAA